MARHLHPENSGDISGLLQRCNLADPALSMVAGALLAVACGVISFPALAKTLPPAEVTAPTTPVGRAYELKYSVSLNGLPNGAETKFRAVSDLLLQKGEPPVSLGELDRRVDRDIQTIGTIMQSEGYYQSDIEYQMDRTQTPIKIRIDVTRGARFTIKSMKAEFDDVDTLTPELRKASEIPADNIGKSARSKRVVETGAEIFRQLPELGYPLAQTGKRSVIVDHADQTMSVIYHFTPGRQAKFGPVKLEGLTTVNESYARKLILWHEGDRYNQAQVDQYRSRLAATGLFNSIRIEHADTVDEDGKMPIMVKLREGKHRTYGGGTSYSSSEGFGARVFWEHRNLFGNQEKLKTTAEATEIIQALNANFIKPNFMRYDQKLIGDLTLARDAPTAYTEYTINSAAAVQRQINKRWAVSAGGTLGYSKITDAAGTRDYYLLGLPIGAQLDASNSLLNPTRGMRMLVSVQPYIGAQSGILQFVRSEMTGSAYFSFDDKDRFVFAARTRVGTIVGAGTERLPATKRFYAGGGTSIRGYKYQYVGPLDAENNPLGGRSIFEVGAEIRTKVSRTIGLVPFIEGGNVFDTTYPDISKNLRWGAGLGIRYYTAFAPIRFDVAVPLNKRSVDASYQIYISIGQSF